MFEESKRIANNIRSKRKHYVLTELKLKKEDDTYLFLDENDNVVNTTNNLNVVNEVVKRLLNLDYFIEFL
jgi:hypothetical protein